jgi:predicted transcriptional regulator YdeE
LHQEKYTWSQIHAFQSQQFYTMETKTIPQDIRVLCVTAASFPAGIMDAFHKVHEMAPGNRTTYGLSHPDSSGEIMYKAAVNELPGDAAIEGLEHFVIEKETYLSVTIHNFMQDLPSIGNTFSMLIKQPGLDPNGYCLEWYLNDKDVVCMVKMKD